MKANWKLWAEDLRMLAWLHLHEHKLHTLLELRAHGFPRGLLAGNTGEAESLGEALDALASASGPGASIDDDLAADYAAIYLTYAYRASPYESVWRDEDHLAWQEPTFAVRAWYERYQLSAGDWRTQADDHLAYELDFVAWLLEKQEIEAAAKFMDAHLLTFLPDFCQLVAQRAATPFYRDLAQLTGAAVSALRQALPEVPPEPDVPARKNIEFPVHVVGRASWLSQS